MEYSKLKFAPIVVSVLLLIIVFKSAIEGMFFSSNSTFIDEVAILFITGIALFSQIRKGVIKHLFLVTALLAAYMVIISILFGGNKSYFSVIVQSFLYLQFFLLLVSIAVIHETHRSFITPTFFIVLIISFLGCVAQIGSPFAFADIFGATDRSLGGGTAGVLRVEGLQKNPNALGILFSLLAVLLMFRPELVKTKSIRVFVLLAALFVVASSGSRSAMLFFGIALFYSGNWKLKKILAI